jgi:hypothetical protein
VRHTQTPVLYIYGSNQRYDLGTPDDLGGNGFAPGNRGLAGAHLTVAGSGNVIHATGKSERRSSSDYGLHTPGAETRTLLPPAQVTRSVPSHLVS